MEFAKKRYHYLQAMLMAALALAAITAMALTYSGGELTVDNNLHAIDALGPFGTPSVCDVTSTATLCGPYEAGAIYMLESSVNGYITLGGSTVTASSSSFHYFSSSAKQIRVKINSGYDYVSVIRSSGDGKLAITRVR